MESAPSITIVDENNANVEVATSIPENKSRESAKKIDSAPSIPIPWKEPSLRSVFLGLVYRNRAYMPTTTSYTQKYNSIAHDLKTNYPQFKKYGNIKGEALKKQFEREKELLITRLALNKEGSNLSSIDNKTLYKMILQTKETPGDEEDNAKTAYTKARLQSA